MESVSWPLQVMPVITLQPVATLILNLVDMWMNKLSNCRSLHKLSPEAMCGSTAEKSVFKHCEWLLSAELDLASRILSI